MSKTEQLFIARLLEIKKYATIFCEHKTAGTLRDWIDTYDDPIAMDALGKLEDLLEEELMTNNDNINDTLPFEGDLPAESVENLEKALKEAQERLNINPYKPKGGLLPDMELPQGKQIPHKCPICDGTGIVSRPPGVAGDQQTWMTANNGPWPCQACLNGIIWR